MPYLRIMPGTQCQQGQYWYPVYLCSPHMGLPPGVFPTSRKYFKLQKLSACQACSFNNDSSRLFNNFIKTVLSLDGNGNRSCITMQYMTVETCHGKKKNSINMSLYLHGLRRRVLRLKSCTLIKKLFAEWLTLLSLAQTRIANSLIFFCFPSHPANIKVQFTITYGRKVQKRKLSAGTKNYSY